MNYPTIAQLNAADKAQVVSWRRTLPPPQTDVERTVWRRIVARWDAFDAEDILTADFRESFKEIFGE